MNLEEARKLIRDDDAGHSKWACAAITIEQETRQEKLSRSAMEDLLVCLKRGGLAASTALCALHGRTGRPWNHELLEKLEGGPIDPDEFKRLYAVQIDTRPWEEYFKEHGFLS
jgi:hypothetical protein